MTNYDVLINGDQENKMPSVGLLTMFRLGLFNLGLGLMSVLTLAVLNRVMISELSIPATITAAALAVPQFMAPAKVWFGQLSDSQKLFNLHRSGYVWLGTILFGTTIGSIPEWNKQKYLRAKREIIKKM